MYNKSIFIFRRDFRLWDNTGLIQALENSEEVLPIFIFDPRQVVNNPFKSDNCVQFMIEALEELDKDLRQRGSRLVYFFGQQHDVIKKLLKKYSVNAIYSNMDYTKFAIDRVNEIKKVCQQAGVDCFFPEDYLILPVASVTTEGGKVYSKFTPYYNKASKKSVRQIESNKRKNYVSGSKKIPYEYPKSKIHSFYKYNEELLEPGGRSYALKILANIDDFKTYNKTRNDPSIPTTHLSAYIKFGCVSIREVYWKFREELGMSNDLIKQLFWRDFFFNLGYDNPEIYDRKALKPNYDKIKWVKNSNWLSKWKNGETGYPIVDAGMRQMNTTGFMHNRLRLITSNFLIKTLGIDWREGETYFAQKLYDYDVSVNNGSWQWSSGSGADSQPYFRIFNPWLQSKRFNSDGEYIYQWIPELKEVEPKHLHQWDKYYKDYDIDYPAPMVDYSQRKKIILKMYENAFK